MREVAVIGAGMNRWGEIWNHSLRQLFVEAALKALDDSGVDRVDSLVVGCMSSGLFVGQEHVGALMADYLGSSACTLGRGFGLLFPQPFQYAFTTPAVEPEDLLSLTFTLDLERTDGLESSDDDDLQFSAYLREGQMVEFETYNLQALLSFDYTIVRDVVAFDLQQDDAPLSVTLTPNDPDLPLKPDTTYYIVFAGFNCPSHTYTLTADLQRAEPEGCGCSSSRRAPAGTLLSGLLLLLGVGRRRRESNPVIQG